MPQAGNAMPTVLVVNPNNSIACSARIDEALAPFRFPGGPALDVETLREGPPAILTWRDWHGVVAPLCRLVETRDADAYVIACASDPDVEAVRNAIDRPVFGVFRCAIATAVARAERFGIIAIVDASKARHLTALRAMGLEARLAAEIALNVSMEALLDGVAMRARLIEAAQALVACGAGTVVLGCTGMAHHRAAVQAAAGVPVIEPCQAAALQAIGAVMEA